MCVCARTKNRFENIKAEQSERARPSSVRYSTFHPVSNNFLARKLTLGCRDGRPNCARRSRFPAAKYRVRAHTGREYIAIYLYRLQPQMVAKALSSLSLLCAARAIRALKTMMLPRKFEGGNYHYRQRERVYIYIDA